MILAAQQYIFTFGCLISDYSFLVANSICEKVGGGFKDMIRVLTPNTIARLIFVNMHNQHAALHWVIPVGNTGDKKLIVISSCYKKIELLEYPNK